MRETQELGRRGKIAGSRRAIFLNFNSGLFWKAGIFFKSGITEIYNLGLGEES